MKINLDQAILNYENEPLVRQGKTPKEELPLTVGYAWTQALNALEPGVPVTAEDKMKMFQISLKLNGSNREPKLTVDQLSMIKEKVAEAWNNPIVYGRTCELIDGPMKVEDE